MSFSERAGRILLLGATLALAWIGQGLLQAEPPRLLGGVVILMPAAIAFTGLVASPHEATSSSARRMARLLALAARSPKNFALIAVGVVCGALTFWFDTNPSMQPWPILLAWTAGIVLFLAGAWRPSEPADIATPATAAQSSAPPHEELLAAAVGEPDALRLSATAAATASAYHAPQIAPIAAEPHVEAGIEYLLAKAPEASADAQPYSWWEIGILVGLTLLALLVRVALIERIRHNFGGDEGEMGMMARDVLSGKLISPFITGWLSHPTPGSLQLFALRVFGDNIFGIRLLGAAGHRDDPGALSVRSPFLWPLDRAGGGGAAGWLPLPYSLWAYWRSIMLSTRCWRCWPLPRSSTASGHVPCLVSRSLGCCSDWRSTSIWAGA